ncbi:MAG: hypothetical protein EXX96DRAFT_610842 [Benjaminiella poitrasii]|nr:MAG: hypothetical protein EXX96DRAFT_610842 [Benjaminiella poitrasii]
MKSLHLIQLLHIWNAIIGAILLGLLSGVSSFIKWFINNGSAIAGFGSFTTFAYPATFVYMFIPTISVIVYSLILAFDSSPKYKAWLPSKTMRSTIVFFTAAVFFAALLPVLPDADVMTDGSSIECLWTNYMQWTTIYNNPIAFPWVTGMEKACSLFKVADAFAWILWLGWLAQSVLYMRAAHQTQSFIKQ